MTAKRTEGHHAMRRHISWMMVLLLAIAGPAAGAQADDRKHDQDTVRQAVERGEIKALADILTAIRGKLPGEVVGVEIEQKKGRWLYEFRVADKKGRLFEVYVDAQSGVIERIKEK
jgi:uncharacterized membrane protein YkoI